MESGKEIQNLGFQAKVNQAQAQNGKETPGLGFRAKVNRVQMKISVETSFNNR